MKLAVFDGNFLIHRALSLAGKHRNIEHIDKNTLSSFLSTVCNVTLQQHATHILVCFDGPHSFRKDIYPKYKANRMRGDSSVIVTAEGKEITVPWTPGKLVKPAKQILGLAGITYSHKKSYEADDLMNCAAKSAVKQGFWCVITTRDKDIAVCVNDKVKLWWPIEKRLMDEATILEHFGVPPHQISDMLALIGDGVDNIPGIEGWGPVKAAKFLKRFGSIEAARNDPEGRKILKPHLKTINLSHRLTVLRDDQHYNMDDCVIQPFDQELNDYVWKIPQSLKELGDTRKASSIKGLFGRLR